MKEVYGQDYVKYQENEPDFYPFIEDIPKAQMNEYCMLTGIKETATGDFDGCVSLEKMEPDRNKTFRLANSEAAKKLGVSINSVRSYMEENNLTWHECGDRKHVIMIPSDINKTFAHTGGIAMQKNIDRFLESLNSTTKGKMVLYRTLN